MRDALTDSELFEITGVAPESRNKDANISRVLKAAGIFHWFKHSGGVATTWHHVHNASAPITQQPAANQPRINKVR